MRLIFLLLLFLVSATGLSLNERNELLRKFKYYFNSVRPTSPENIITNRNGTFFVVTVDVNLLSTTVKATSLTVECVVVFSWLDDRLVLRELNERLELPEEFTPWMPRLRTEPGPHTTQTFLSTTTGAVSVYYSVKADIDCTDEAWKYPFGRMSCPFNFALSGKELLNIETLRDLRSEGQRMQAVANLRDGISAGVDFHFTCSWHSALIKFLLPSFLIVAVVFFAQWKRRKVQVLVCLSSLICMLIMLTTSRPHSAITLLDLWLSVSFVHLVFLLIVDLTLPARRVRYTLMLPVDQVEHVDHDIIRRAESNSQPGSRVLLTIEKLAGRAMRRMRSHESTSSQRSSRVVSTEMAQRTVTTTSVGERKRVALLAVACSYIAFVFLYFVVAASIK